MRKPVRLLGTILGMPVALLACLPLFVWELCRYRPYNIPWAPRGWWLLLRWAVLWGWPVLPGIVVVTLLWWTFAGTIRNEETNRNEIGNIRSDVIHLGASGRLKWYFTETEARLENLGPGALKCSRTERLYGGESYPLIHAKSSISTGVLRLPTHEFLAGCYCGALAETDHRSIGVRVDPGYPLSP
jgi:hypothetical protein